MSIKQLQQFQQQKEEKFDKFQLQTIELLRQRQIAANYYIFYLSLMLKLSLTNVPSGYAVVMMDPMTYMESSLALCKGDERFLLLHRCHIAFQHYLVNDNDRL